MDQRVDETAIERDIYPGSPQLLTLLPAFGNVEFEQSAYVVFFESDRKGIECCDPRPWDIYLGISCIHFVHYVGSLI